mgnify:CR=1 FL=1
MPENPEIKIKFDILKKYLPWLAACPYTRVVFLAGSVATKNPKPESDIDLIIISEHKRVWLNRLFLELGTWVLGIRRSRKKIKNRFCFNMFLSNCSPALPHQDLIGASFYKNIKPAWGDKREIKNFWKDNSWLIKFYNLSNENEKIIFPEKNKITNFIKIFLEFFLEKTKLAVLLEKISLKLQTTYIKSRLEKTVADKNSKDFDFNLTADLIAYHFPVSNYALKLKKYRENNGFSDVVDKTPEKFL